LPAGGPHATALPAAALLDAPFDGVLAGEADRLLPRLAGALKRTRRLPVGRFPGLCCRELALSLGLDALHLFSATPLPGSRLWEETGGS